MRRGAAASFIVLVLFFSGVLQSLNLARGQTQNINYTIKMSVTYSNLSEDKIWDFTKREDDRTISLFQNNLWQTVELKNSTFPIEARKNDTDGNPVAVLEFPEGSLHLIPGQNLTFSTAYRVVSKPRFLLPITEEGSGVLQNISKDLRDKYTKEEGPWLVNNSMLKTLAHIIAGDETRVLSVVIRLVSWIQNPQNIKYKVHEVPFYANQTLTQGEGDCDDQAILLVTLSRILGIPAYLQIGAIHLPDNPPDLSTHWEGHAKELTKMIGWHGWAMVYVPPWGWLPVDLTFIWGGGIADPLRAIKNAAVTSRSVIQYMNVTKFDYVASSLQARDFLISNNFYVYMEDEMIEEAGQQSPFGEGSGELLIVGFIAVVAILGLSSFFISKKLKRLTEPEPREEVPEPQQ